MTAPMHGLEARVLDVRVNLRRGDAGVTEQFLQGANFGPALTR